MNNEWACLRSIKCNNRSKIHFTHKIKEIICHLPILRTKTLLLLLLWAFVVLADVFIHNSSLRAN